MKDLLNAKNLLSTGKFTCVICKDETVYTSNLRGVRPLVEWYESNITLTNFSAADKVIGKATAFLYVLLDIKNVHANVISKPALKVLKESSIYVEYNTLVDNIINRTGDGICPFEKVVSNETNEMEAYKLIRLKMKELNIEIK